MAAVTPYSIRKAASDFGIPFREAVFQRLIFVRCRLLDVADEIQQADEVMAELAFRELVELAEEQRTLAGIIRQTIKPQTSGLTQEQIEQARQVPIDRIVTFTRGKAVAWCHSDNNPSLTFMGKTNRAWCPVCDKWFNPIDVLTQRDAQSFTSAVRTLCGAL